MKLGQLRDDKPHLKYWGTSVTGWIIYYSTNHYFYFYSLFIKRNFIAQGGDPTGTGTGGACIYG